MSQALEIATCVIIYGAMAPSRRRVGVLDGAQVHMAKGKDDE